MEKSLSDLDKLKALLDEEWARYKRAIKENKKLEDVKIIYIHIKEMQKELDEVADRIHQKIEERNSN
ncbi:MAG TPA: hypothetical protein VEV62_07125 [Parafilimonas sp.]|nr:hypothetical protein [Parafilimonas sp.]